MEKKGLDFLIVGAAKSGTTTLHDLLCQHPKVCLPRVKETHYFDIKTNYERGIEFYQAFFESCNSDESVIGEVTPSYMYVEGVARRIYDTLGGDIKLIFILRHPVQRAYSHFNFNVARGIESLSFDEALELEKERIQISPKHNRRYSYISRGFYHKQVSEFLKYFNKSQMHFIIFEEFIESRIESLNGLLRFLNLDDDIVVENIKSNYTSKPRSRIVRYFINRDSVFKDIIRNFFKPQRRRQIRNFIRDLNVGTKLNSNVLDSENIRDLTDKYFRQDIISFEKIVGRKISKWH